MDLHLIGMSPVKKSETHYKNGKTEGLFTLWYESGGKGVEGHYKNGKKEGLQTGWYESGEKEQKSIFKKDRKRIFRSNYRNTNHHLDAPLILSQKKYSFFPNTMQKLFRRMYRRVGLDSASSHSGRRTFFTNLIDVGIALTNVQKLI
jgi:integrase